MARTYQMTWEGHPGYRWKKMHRGAMYRVSCADLGFPENRWTKEDTYQAANEWWGRKRSELEFGPVSPAQAEQFAGQFAELEADRVRGEIDLAVKRMLVAEQRKAL